MCAVSVATVYGIHRRYFQSGFETLIHGGRGGT
jgi:hypothetical protein